MPLQAVILNVDNLWNSFLQFLNRIHWLVHKVHKNKNLGHYKTVNICIKCINHFIMNFVDNTWEVVPMRQRSTSLTPQEYIPMSIY